MALSIVAWYYQFVIGTRMIALSLSLKCPFKINANVR